MREFIILTCLGQKLTKEAEQKVEFFEKEDEDYELDKKDFEKTEDTQLIYTEEISTIINDSEEGGSLVYTTRGLAFNVKETVEEIQELLK